MRGSSAATGLPPLPRAQGQLGRPRGRGVARAGRGAPPRAEDATRASGVPRRRPGSRRVCRKNSLSSRAPPPRPRIHKTPTECGCGLAWQGPPGNANRLIGLFRRLPAASSALDSGLSLRIPASLRFRGPTLAPGPDSGGSERIGRRMPPPSGASKDRHGAARQPSGSHRGHRAHRGCAQRSATSKCGCTPLCPPCSLWLRSGKEGTVSIPPSPWIPVSPFVPSCLCGSVAPPWPRAQTAAAADGSDGSDHGRHRTGEDPCHGSGQRGRGTVCRDLPSPTATCNWPLATGHWQLATGHRQPATGNRPLATGHWQLATGHWQLATGHWQLATGHWQPATGHWPLATGHRQPATGNRPPATGHRQLATGNWPPRQSLASPPVKPWHHYAANPLQPIATQGGFRSKTTISEGEVV